MAKVLVVDDEANLRKVLATMLRRTGYDVTVAADGEQGLAEFLKSGADIVGTDLAMPKMAGMELWGGGNSGNPAAPGSIITAPGTHDPPVEGPNPAASANIPKRFDQPALQL